MKEHHKRRNSTEEFYKNYLKEIEKRMETKSERASTIVEQKKQERNYTILRFVTYMLYFLKNIFLDEAVY